MKKITLHDGRKANFPDNASPEVIAKKIAELMTETPKPKATGADHPAIKKAALRVAAAQKKMDADDKAKKAEQAARDQKDDQRHDEIIKAHEATTKSTNALASHTRKIGEGLGDLGKNIATGHQVLGDLSKKLDKVGDAPEALTKLASEVADLRDAIVQSTAAILKVMRTPRKLIHNAKGTRALGIALQEDEPDAPQGVKH